MRTIFEHEGRPVACGHIDPLPGSTQVAVFHSAFVLPEYRNQGIGKKAHQERLRLAKENLYDFALCTVDSTNTVQIKNLEANGWILRGSFFSNKTKHQVRIYGLDLNGLDLDTPA
jgi:ribosomal protein S18 acetylase RimI-like enzyme